jgi:hypothetical protein
MPFVEADAVAVAHWLITCCLSASCAWLMPHVPCQANVWVAIFGFIGNYFWTHYFFNLLGAAYTLPSHRLNGVSRQADRQLASQPASS